MTRTYTLPASISALDALIGELAYIVRYLYYMLLRVFGWPINPIRLTDLSGINPLVDMLVFVGQVCFVLYFSPPIQNKPVWSYSKVEVKIYNIIKGYTALTK